MNQFQFFCHLPFLLTNNFTPENSGIKREDID